MTNPFSSMPVATSVALGLLGCASGTDFPDPPTPSQPCDGSYVPEPVDFSRGTALTAIGHDEQGRWILAPGTELVGFDPNGVSPDELPTGLLPDHLRDAWPPEAIEPDLDVWDVSGASLVREYDAAMHDVGTMPTVALESFDADGHTLARFRTNESLRPLDALHRRHARFTMSQVSVPSSEPGSSTWTWIDTLTDERDRVRLEVQVIDSAGASSLPERPTGPDASVVTVFDYDAWGHPTASYSPSEQAALVRASEPQTAADGRTVWPQLALDAPLGPDERYSGAVVDGGQTRLVQLEDLEPDDGPPIPTYRAIVLCPVATRTEVLTDWFEVDATVGGRVLATRRLAHVDGLAHYEEDSDGDGILDTRIAREALDGRGSVETTTSVEGEPVRVETLERDRTGRPVSLTLVEDDVLVYERRWTHP